MSFKPMGMGDKLFCSDLKSFGFQFTEPYEKRILYIP